MDIEGSTTRNDFLKSELRRAMYELVEASLVAGGIDETCRDPFVDRGDGILTLIRPMDEVPKTFLLSRVIPILETSLADYARRCPDRSFRLRAVVHAGEVHFDGRGWCGEALNVAFDLLDAREVKKRLRMSERPLLLVVSEHIYTSVVRQGYEGIDEHEFFEVPAVEVAGRRHRGWIRLPDSSGDGGTIIDVHRKHHRRHRPSQVGPDERFA